VIVDTLHKKLDRNDICDSLFLTKKDYQMKNNTNKLCFIVFAVFFVIFTAACDSSPVSDPPSHPPESWPGWGGGTPQPNPGQNFVFTFVPPVNNIPVVSGITITINPGDVIRIQVLALDHSGFLNTENRTGAILADSLTVIR